MRLHKITRAVIWLTLFVNAAMLALGKEPDPIQLLEAVVCSLCLLVLWMDAKRPERTK